MANSKMAKRKLVAGSGKGDEILTTLMLPSAMSPIRFSDEFSASETALSHPKARLPVKWQQTGGNFDPTIGAQLPVTDFFFALFRDPLRAFIYYAQNPGTVASPGAANSWYMWYYTKTTNRFVIIGNGDVAVYKINPSAAYPVTAANGNIISPFVATEWSPHGDILFAGAAFGNKYFWIDGTSTQAWQIKIAFYTALNVLYPMAAKEYSVYVYAYGFGGDTLIAVVDSTALASAIVINFTNSGYIRIEIVASSGPRAANNIIVAQNSTCSMFSHNPLPALLQNADTLQAIRLNCLSFLLENEAALLYKQGKCAVTQVGKNENWNAYANNTSPFQKLLSVADEKDFLLEHGMYGYLRPTDNKDFEMESPLILGNQNQWVTASFNLQEDSEFIVGMASNSNGAQGSDCYLNFDFHSEFETNNTWFYTAIPEVMPERWKAAFIALRKKRQFFSNESHYKEILGDISATIHTFAPLAPLIGMAMMGGM